jgi:hypothetical protein
MCMGVHYVYVYTLCVWVYIMCMDAYHVHACLRTYADLGMVTVYDLCM